MSETWERLKVTLAELGIEPKKSLGQNFLISDSVIEKIIRAGKDSKPDFLLEIGPGPGALTFFLDTLTKPMLTLSIGVATFPDHGSDPDELTQAADQALLKAKKAGRNQTQTAVLI